MVYESFPSENLCMTSTIDEDEESVIYVRGTYSVYVCTWIMEKMGHNVHTQYIGRYGWYNKRRYTYSGTLFIRPHFTLRSVSDKPGVGWNRGTLSTAQ